MKEETEEVKEIEKVNSHPLLLFALLFSFLFFFLLAIANSFSCYRMKNLGNLK